MNFGLLDPELERELGPEQAKALKRMARLQAGIQMFQANQATGQWGDIAAAGLQGYTGGLQSGVQDTLAQRRYVQEKRAMEDKARQQQAYAQALSDPRFLESVPENMRGAYAAVAQNSPEVFANNILPTLNRPAQLTDEQKETAAMQRRRKSGEEAGLTGQLLQDYVLTGRYSRPKPVAPGRGPSGPAQPAKVFSGADLGITGPGAEAQYTIGKDGTPKLVAQPQLRKGDPGTKQPAFENASMLLDQAESLLDNGLKTGPLDQYTNRLFNAEQAQTFDLLNSQMAPSLRKIFRIPGEGALSDSEQKANGLVLPTAGYREDVNRQAIANLRKIIARETGNPMPEAQKRDDDPLGLR